MRKKSENRYCKESSKGRQLCGGIAAGQLSGRHYILSGRGMLRENPLPNLRRFPEIFRKRKRPPKGALQVGRQLSSGAEAPSGRKLRRRLPPRELRGEAACPRRWGSIRLFMAEQLRREACPASAARGGGRFRISPERSGPWPLGRLRPAPPPRRSGGG